MIEFRPGEERDIPGLRALWTQAFGDSGAFLDSFFAHAFAPERCRVAAEDGKCLAMAYWFDCMLGKERLAYLYAVATEADHQGRGIGSKLIRDIHRVLEERGYAGAVLSPQEEGLYEYYRGFGYETAGWRKVDIIRAGMPGNGARVTPEDYAVLRRRLLPEHGLVQEGAALAFLGAMADFYAGEGWCAAVAREEEAILEFLGDAQGCPGLLGTLGWDFASVTGPGKEEPCAMACWFREKEIEEIYLGFPFD